MTVAVEPQQEQLQALDELQLVLARVRLRARRRAAWLAALHAEDADPARLALADADAPAHEAAWRAAGGAAELEAALAEVEAALADAGGRLALLQRLFGLDSQDCDLLQLCLAHALDPDLGPLFAALQGHPARAYPSEELAARLFDHGRCLVWGVESPLRTWELLRVQEQGPGEPVALTCDRQVRDWLLGVHDLDAALAGVARLHAPLPPLRGWPVDALGAWLHQTVDGAGEPARVRVVGPPGSGRRSFAAAVVAARGMPLLTIDADAVEEHEWRRIYARAQRQAFLQRCALAWHGQAAARRPWPPAVTPFPIQFLIVEAGQQAAPAPELVERTLALPAPTLEERRELWLQAMPAAASWPPEVLETLAARQRLSVGMIAAVARAAPRDAEEAAAMAGADTGRLLGDLAQRVKGAFGWDDLVVGERLRVGLDDLAFEARERARFWEQPAARRLFPQGRGLTALFSGPPGTGKTMAAQVIAAAVGLDLYRIDLSAVVSKYVGETAQHLERLLARAAQVDAVLLFDEADALFARRTEVNDAHDRFANTDTNHLLQAIEGYDGVAILATNRQGNIDTAFFRRLRFVLEFPRPDAGLRRRIWQRLTAELAGAEAVERLSPALDTLANEVEVSGAQIKLALLGGLFAARRDGADLAVPHLLRGIERELAKDGRALSARERERLQRGRP